VKEVGPWASTFLNNFPRPRRVGNNPRKEPNLPSKIGFSTEVVSKRKTKNYTTFVVMDNRNKKSDFEWVLSQAADHETILKIKQIIENERKFRETGIQQTGDELIHLNFKGFNITTIGLMTHSILHGLPQLFEFRENYAPTDFLTKKDKILIDLGANEGFYTLYSKIKNPALKVFCVEPNPHALRLLKLNIERNGLKDVACINKAIFSANIKKKLEIIRQASSLSSFKINRDRDWINDEMIEKIDVECITLDTFYDYYAPNESIDILKIDVEGAELDVLRGGIKTINFTKKIELETHSLNLEEECRQFLTERHFKTRGVFELTLENKTIFYQR